MITRACMTLNLSRAALGVCATPRGVVWGPIGFGGDVHLAEQTIPDPAHVSSLVSSAVWIMVVEKHAMYQTLRAIDFLGQVRGHLPPGAVVTGKGYPDHATRWMLGELARHTSATHLLFLVDSDPHGVDIFRTYQDALPSRAQVHWIGLRARQWLRLQMAHAIPTMPLTRADRAKAKSMLSSAALPPALRHELGEALHLGYKCELEVLCMAADGHPQCGAASGILAEFLISQIRSAIYSCGDDTHGTRPVPRPFQGSHRPGHRSGGGGSPLCG